MEKIRIGIVGIGNMGSAHAVSVYAGRIEGLTLAAVCDIDEAKCRWAAQHLPGVPCYTDYEDMLAEAKLDAVLIAAPHYAHPPMAEAAFARRLHVLTEKPLGVSARRAGAVLEAAKAAGTVFGIMYNQRTNPLFARAKELLQAGPSWATQAAGVDHHQLVPHPGVLRLRFLAGELGGRGRRRTDQPVPGTTSTCGSGFTVCPRVSGRTADMDATTTSRWRTM